MSLKNSAENTPTERNLENCLRRRDALFSVKRLVTLGKTNAYGGAYFAQFFAWTGEAREELMARAGRLDSLVPHTSEARMKYFRELLPLEEFEIFVWPRANRMSLSLRFFFLRDSELVAVGDQEVCLKSAGRLIEMPQPMREFIARFDPR